MKKIVSMLIFFMMFITITTVGLSSPILQDNLKTPHKPYFVDNENDLKFKVDVEDIFDPSQQKASKFNFDIVDLIEQVDESILLKYLENLTSFGPRVTATPACDQAGQWIYSQLNNLGISVRYQNWTDGSLYGSNIEGTIYGTENEDLVYIICAHYDSVPGSPGADDDGSGTALVLAAAEIMSQYSFDYTIRFVAFSGEEQGLVGSYYYVEEAYSNGDQIVATLNADMIGFAISTTDGNRIKVFDDDNSQWITDYTTSVSQIYDEYIGLQVIDSGYTYGSDHYYFWEFGYNAVFYHEYNFNDYYHSPQDTIDHMNLTYYKKCSRLVIATLAELSIHEGAELEIGEIKGGLLKIEAEILNNGTIDATEVNWTIDISGKFVDPFTSDAAGIIDILSSGRSEIVKATPVLGFGQITVSVSANAPFSNVANKEVKGFVFFIFVIITNY